jgi:pimeloyl-ACP methyl ester carboxylesterase
MASNQLEGTPFAAIAAESRDLGGFCRVMTHHIAAHLPTGHRRLVVTFDNLASNRETDRRYPWGHGFLADKGWDILGVMALRWDWFRHPDLWDLFDELRDTGFFAGYDHVAFYGASMGGYGALSFASAAPGCTVLAFAPQSSLDRAIVPFEKRYKVLGDWTGRYADAADGARAARQAYIAFDPRVKPDLAHVMRLDGANVVQLRMPGVGHKVPPALQRMGILKPVALAALEGALDMQAFHRHYRARRQSIPWVIGLLERAAKRKHARLALRVAENQWKTRLHWKLRLLVNDLRAINSGNAPT